MKISAVNESDSKEGVKLSEQVIVVDVVNHEILTEKLQLIGIAGSLLPWI